MNSCWTEIAHDIEFEFLGRVLIYVSGTERVSFNWYFCFEPTPESVLKEIHNPCVFHDHIRIELVNSLLKYDFNYINYDNLIKTSLVFVENYVAVKT